VRFSDSTKGGGAGAGQRRIPTGKSLRGKIPPGVRDVTRGTRGTRGLVRGPSGDDTAGDPAFRNDDVLTDLCLQSTVLHLDGLRTRYGYVMGASLRTPRSLDVTRGASDHQDPDVVFADTYTLLEAAEACDDPENHFSGVAVDVSGLAPDAPERVESERVRCWFVRDTAARTDYVVAVDGHGAAPGDVDSVHWARLRRDAPLGHKRDDPRAGFREPACMTKTCDFSLNPYPAPCQRVAQTYCKNAGNVYTEYCRNFFASTDGDADAILAEHCLLAVNDVNGKLSALDPRDRDLCGCHYRESVYSEYFAHLRGASNAQKHCAASICANSKYKPRNVKNNTARCPNLQVCVQNCNIKVNGVTVRDINCKQHCELRAAEGKPDELPGESSFVQTADTGRGWFTATAADTGRGWFTTTLASDPNKGGGERHTTYHYRNIGVALGLLALGCALAYGARKEYRRRCLARRKPARGQRVGLR
jgi:hypothetical protein